MTVPSKEVMFQSVGTPVTGVPRTVVTGRWHPVVVAVDDAEVVVAGEADDEQADRVPATTRSARATLRAARRRTVPSWGSPGISGVLHPAPGSARSGSFLAPDPVASACDGAVERPADLMDLPVPGGME